MESISLATTDRGAGSTVAFVRSAVASYGAYLIGTVLGFFSTPVIFRGLGPAAFGLFSLTTALSGYLALVELGVGTATLRRVAAARAHADEARLRVVVASNVAVNAVFGVVATLLLSGAVVFLPQMFGLSSAETMPARIALALTGAAVVLTFCNSSNIALVVGSGRAASLSMVGAILAAAGTIASMLAATAGGGLPSVAGIGLLVALLTAMASRALARRLMGGQYSLNDARRSVVRELIGSGAKNAVIAVGSILATGSDLVIVGLVSDARHVAAYAVASRGVAFAKGLTTRLADALVPTFAHSNSRDDSRRVWRLFEESVFAGFGLAIPIALIFVFMGRALLHLWLGELPEGSYSVLALLALGMVVQYPGHCCYTLLSSIERLRFLAVSVLLVGAGNCALSLLLAIKFGIVGPAIGTLISVAILDAVVLPAYVLRQFGVRWRTFFSRVLRPHILATLTLMTALQVAPAGAPRAWALLWSALGFGGYVAILWASLGKDRRKEYRTLLHSATKR